MINRIALFVILCSALSSCSDAARDGTYLDRTSSEQWAAMTPAQRNAAYAREEHDRRARHIEAQQAEEQGEGWLDSLFTGAIHSFFRLLFG